MKYESKPWTVGLLNIVFLLTTSTTIVSMKSLTSLVVATVLETYPYISLISRCLHLMFLILSIAETIIGVNEASRSGKVFSLFLLSVLSLLSWSEEIISPSSAMLLSLSDVSDSNTSFIFPNILINLNFCK